MATTVKQWEEAWSRLVEARKKLRSFERSVAIVRHILILDNIKPGDTISLDYGFGEPVPPVEVLMALEKFDKALRREDGAFRRLRKSDMAAVANRREFGGGERRGLGSSSSWVEPNSTAIATPTEPIWAGKLNIFARLFYQFRRSAKALRMFAVIAGPGIIVMVADNDAGGITTYTVTGAKYGNHLLWFLILLGPVAYFVQEMTVRLGAVTKRGHAEAIFCAFGSFWGWFSLLDLVLTDWLTMITEFIGMTAAMSIFGVPAWITVIGCWLVMGAMIVTGRYWTWEKIALVFCVGNLIYIPAAFMVHPSLSDIFRNSLVPHFPPGGFTNDLFFLLMANIGTTIAPWMLFFQQSSVVDKGLQEKDISFGQWDTAIGSFLTVIVATFLIIVCAKLLPGKPVESAAEAAIQIMPTSKYVGTIIAIGLFDAGLLGAICISLASSWAFGEVFGWAHSLNKKIQEAPWFYAYYFFDLVLAGTVVLIPKAPLVLITLFVQVIATTLLPAALVFLILLLNDEKTMGKYVNTTWQNVVNISIVVFIIVVSTMYGVSTLFPNLLQ